MHEASRPLPRPGIHSKLQRKPPALEALRKAWEAGLRDTPWARRDPDLALRHGDPDFERLYAPPSA